MPPIDDPLVSTDWLSARIDDPKVKIIDASFKMPGVLPLPVDDYLAAHIPGAVFFDVDAISDHNNPRPHMYPDATQFARDIEALGISSGDTVVAYDSGGWVAAPRAWWMFLSFGHRDVKALDGGLKKWLSEGRPTHSGKVTPKPGKFRAELDRLARFLQGLPRARNIFSQHRSKCHPQRAASAVTLHGDRHQMGRYAS